MLACQRGGWLIIKSARVLLLALAMMPIGVMRRCVRVCVRERGSVRGGHAARAHSITLVLIPLPSYASLPWYAFHYLRTHHYIRTHSTTFVLTPLPSYSSKHFLFREIWVEPAEPFFPKSQVQPVLPFFLPLFFWSGSTRFFRKNFFFGKKCVF